MIAMKRIGFLTEKLKLLKEQIKQIPGPLEPSFLSP